MYDIYKHIDFEFWILAPALRVLWLSVRYISQKINVGFYQIYYDNNNDLVPQMLISFDINCECLYTLLVSDFPKNNEGKASTWVESRLQHTLQNAENIHNKLLLFCRRALESSSSAASFCQRCRDKPQQKIWLLNVPGCVYRRCCECSKRLMEADV